MSSNVSDLSEGVVEQVAEACCNDILARDVADKQCTPAFEDCDPETQTFWRHIARAAIATLSPPASPQGVERLREMSRKLDLVQCEDVLSAADEMERQCAALQWIERHYADQDMSHADFRVEAYRRALSALPLSGDPI